MSKQFLFFTLILAASLFLFNSNQARIETYHAASPPVNLSSVNPPAARTGAPGESNCTSCHTGTAQSAAGIIDVSFSGAGNEYIVGQSYTFTISIASGAKNGFEATVLDGTNTKAGSFSSGTAYSIATASGRQYVRQNSSSGITSWTINWTAPATDVGDLTLYFAFNKSNALNNSSGDIIYLGQFNIASAVFNTVTEYETTDAQINLTYSNQQQSADLCYTLFDPGHVIFSVQDLSGRLLTQQNLGNQAPGLYKESITLSEKPETGIYILSLFINNNVYNRKVYIN